jgi:hypothetical protein
MWAISVSGIAHLLLQVGDFVLLLFIIGSFGSRAVDQSPFGCGGSSDFVSLRDIGWPVSPA